MRAIKNWKIFEKKHTAQRFSIGNTRSNGNWIVEKCNAGERAEAENIFIILHDERLSCRNLPILKWYYVLRILRLEFIIHFTILQQIVSFYSREYLRTSLCMHG